MLHDYFISLFTCTVVHNTMSFQLNMAICDLPHMYAWGPRATGPRASGIHIRQITNGHVTSIMYHFVPIATTPVVLIP